MILEYSFKYKTSGGTWSKKKEDMEPWTLHSVSRLKFKILFIILFPISNHIHHDDNDNMIIFCQIQHIWRTLKMWSFELHIACHVWNTKSLSIILIPLSNYIDHWGNDDLRAFFQIQDICRALKSKEGRYGALNIT